MERLIMEAYKLLQKGDMQQAESLLLEGKPCSRLHHNTQYSFLYQHGFYNLSNSSSGGTDTDSDCNDC